MQNVRIIEIPDCKMVSSGSGMFGQAKFDGFCEWFSHLPKTVFPKDYLYFDGEGFCWLYLYDEGLAVPPEYEIVDFRGGLYSVATDIDRHTDVAAMDREVDAFLAEYGLCRDESRFKMGNIITSPLAAGALGYEQMDYYSPVMLKK